MIKSKRLSQFLLPFLILMAPICQGAIQVFACEPEWSALVSEIAGDRAKVFSATTAFQDPHHIEARPSLIAKMRKADLVVCSGAELEVGWLPLLLRSAGNKKVQPGTAGYFEAAQQIQRLGIPEVVDRAHGDVHAAGNPHVHLDPRRLQRIAAKLTERLALIDAENEAHYLSGLQRFNGKMEQMYERRRDQIESLKGKAFVTHHKDWTYLFDWLQVKIHTTIESKPGIPPSSADLKRLLNSVEGENLSGIVMAVYQNDRAAKWLAKQSGLPLIKLPYTVGGNEESVDLISLFEDSLDRLSQR